MRASAVVLLFGLSAIAGAQTTAASAPKMTQAEAMVSSLTKLEDSWTVALVRRDRATFERLLAPKFVYTEDARMMTRQEFLRETFGNGDVVSEARNDSMEVHGFGNTAVVTGWLTVKGQDKTGQAFDRRYRFTDVWMPRSGSWQIVAAHDYLVPTGK